jgi:hypothetical protein
MIDSQADSAASALGTPPDGVEATAQTSPQAPSRQPHESFLAIRVYDYCREHGPHTDPQLRAAEQSYL